MESFFATAGGWIAGLTGFIAVASAVLKTPVGKKLWHRNVTAPAREMVAGVVKDEVAPLKERLEQTNSAFEAHMADEKAKDAVLAERDIEARRWRAKVDGDLEDSKIRSDRVEQRLDTVIRYVASKGTR